MIGRLFNFIHRKERALANSFGRDIATPRGRLGAQIHFQLMDHQFLRHLWTNFDQVAPGVYRSNQPDRRRLRRLKARGIKTILNLRGPSDGAHYLFEKESCDALGMELFSMSFNARCAPDKEATLALIALFAELPRPFLMHCKSGADRAGFASVLYLLTQEGAPLREAKKHLSFKYLHLSSTATGILDHVLDLYAPHEAEMSFETWLRELYDAEAATASFAELRKQK